MNDAQPQTSTKPRSALVAGVLAAIVPGLGHLYAGDLVGAFVVVAAYLVITPSLAAGTLVPGALATLAWAAIVVAAAIWVGQIVLAVRSARRDRAYVLRRFNRGWVYVAFWIATSLVSRAVGGTVRRSFIEPFRIPSESMWPTLIEGDQFFVVKAGPASRWDRGDVVVATFGDPAPQKHVSRVIARGGDVVEIEHGVVKVNGAELVETPVGCPSLPVRAEDNSDGAAVCAREQLPSGKNWIVRHIPSMEREFAPTRVPEGRVFLMGDNRENSSDSRYLGTIPEEKIVGRADVIWLSLSSTLRWQSGQIGTRL